jgi:hypothetical protein
VSATTISEAIERVSAAYAALEELGETVEVEWSYVTDLGAVWQARFDAITGVRGSDAIDEAAAVAVDTSIEEIALITDPHRAIDWLSTFPQVVLLALGEPE